MYASVASNILKFADDILFYFKDYWKLVDNYINYNSFSK